jgi:hypothetical protein
MRPNSRENIVTLTRTVGGRNYSDDFTQSVEGKAVGRPSANFQIECDRSFITLAGLKLDGVAFIQIFDLAPRREAAAMEEHIFAAVIRLDKAKPLIPYDFLDRPSHISSSPINLARLSRLILTILTPILSVSTRLHITKATLSSILYYITGHGYGHAVRSHQVIHALASARADLRIHVRTAAPEWLFHNVARPVHYSRQAIDVGIIQRDSLRMDLSETLAACARIYNGAKSIIERELALIRSNNIRLIVGDTPPLCFEIADRAAIPSVSITNFTWDVIYRAYIDELPGFRPIVEKITAFYGQTTLALTLPYPCDTSMFPRRQAIPWVARESSLTKAQARRKFDLPERATIVLLSFGGLGLERLPWPKLNGQRRFFFVTTGENRKLEGNLLVLPDTQSQYEDLVRAVDVIVTKPGYGIVADVLAHRLPILYTERGEFPEYPRLVEALNDCATAEFIPQDELLAGNLAVYLERLLSKVPNWPQVDLNGAQIAAQRLLSMLDDSD